MFNMPLEKKRKLACVGMFAFIPVALLGVVFDLKDSQFYGCIFIVTILTGMISAPIVAAMKLSCRCPSCGERYFSFLMILFVSRNACKECGWSDTSSGQSNV